MKPDLNKRISLEVWGLRALLLLVMVLPSLVPTGYMIARNPETNLVEITICSGVNHRQVWLDVESGTYLESANVNLDQAPTVEHASSEICELAFSGVDALQTRIDHALPDQGQLAFRRFTYRYLAAFVGYLPPLRGPPNSF